MAAIRTLRLNDEKNMSMNVKGYFIGLCCSLLLCGCQKENLYSPFSGGGEGEVQLQFLTAGLLNRYVVTTKGDVKTSEEQEIHSLHVFIFDSEGNYLEALDDHRYQGYRQLAEGKTVMNIDCEGWADMQKAKNATIIVVANVEAGTFQGATDGTHPTNIENESDLTEGVYVPSLQRAVTALPDVGMPMYARLTRQDLTESHTGQTIDIPLQAMMARVDVSLQLNSDHTDVESGLLPSLTVTKCEVLNAPKGAYYTEDVTRNTDLNALGEMNYSWQPAVQTIYNRDGALEFSFYVFENLQDSTDYDYPEGIEDQDPDKQKYKPFRTDTTKAMAFRFTGNYVTYNGASYEAAFTLYLGANHTDDFNVRRNKQYKNNVTIKGLMNVDDTEEHATFDARVEVSASNPYFISILKDRKLDCHFNVVPMDVYFVDIPGDTKERTIDVEILDPEVNDWVRMEKIESEDMEAGTVSESGFTTNTHLAAQEFDVANKAWRAGNGKRKYFTINLVTETLAAKTRVENITHRDRIYFYVDENLDVWHLGTQEDRTRMATVKITYKEDGKAVSSRELVLEQSKLLEVTFHDSGEENDRNGEVIYIEAYEEYLDYADPLDEYTSNQVFTGLPWQRGNGTEIGTIEVERYDRDWRGNWDSGNVDCHANYFWGHDFTTAIVRVGETNMLRDMYLNGVPNTAAGYCYNKNKRDVNGNIINPKWYLPGIRELERILEDYYVDYEEFREHFYWSSAAGESGDPYWLPFLGWQWTFNGEDRTQARASKAYITTDEDGNEIFAYYESGVAGENGQKRTMYEVNGDSGDSGRAMRTTSLRIRAARIDNLAQ